ncbi:MAG: transcriptional regulator [Deltaproteobacteria bacterium]|nr:transcriptional regulator [Deltaproteobacteria bacterium]MBW2519365.1 transcriptional regulator [Deltaproteobacteria bacterium]
MHDVIRLLEARYGATVDELAEECAVTRRTIYRDLEAISDAGYPLVNERQEDGTVIHRFITRFKQIPPITFSLEELMTLYLCRGQLAFLRGTPFQDDLDAIFARIRSSLPPRSVAHLERIAEAGTPKFQGLHDYAAKSDLLKDLRKALLFQYSTDLTYSPAKRPTEIYRFDPYRLLFYDGALYLGGYAHNRNALRLFLVDRIQSVTVLKDRFELPENFTDDQLTGRAFGLVDENLIELKVLFSSEIAHLILERRWHPSQVVDKQADGSVILSLSASGEREILAWLYSYLPHVKVLAPDDLRKKFYASLQQALGDS